MKQHTIVPVSQTEYVHQTEGQMTVTTVRCSARDWEHTVERPTYREGWYAAQIEHGIHVEKVGGNDLWGAVAGMERAKEQQA